MNQPAIRCESLPTVDPPTLALIKQSEQALLSMLLIDPISENEQQKLPISVSDTSIDELRNRLAALSGDDPRTICGLGNRFGLNPLERDILLLSFGPDIDPRNRASLSRVSKIAAPDGRPRIGLIAQILGETTEQMLEVRAALGQRGRLRRFRLIDVAEKFGWAEADAVVFPTPVIRDLLLGHGYPVPGEPMHGVAEEAPKEIECGLHAIPDKGSSIMVVGERAADRRATAAALAARCGLPILLRRITPSETREAEAQQIAELMRDAVLHNAVAAAEFDELDPRHLPTTLTRLLDRRTMASGSRLLLLPHDLSGALAGAAQDCLTCEAQSVDYAAIRRRWQRGLNAAGFNTQSIKIDSLAGRFNLEPWAIQSAIERAKPKQKQTSDTLEERALLEAAKSLSGRQAVTHARRTVPRYKLDDMVLPPTVRDHLELLIGFATERERLLYQFGYAKRFTIGHGLVALLSGESGTGKTMAAEVLAGALNKDLYIVDLSQLVSKWVGETEKHIDQVFTEAEQAGGVLLFDEADALFANRSGDVSSSNDRYANMEVGYLLQRIESFRGVAILTTNLSQCIDDAFLRRFHFRIDVPRPTAELRRELWAKMLPNGEYEIDGLDLDYLARQFDLTGGNIRNALLKATYLADQNQRKISQSHLVDAAMLECVELGRLV